MIVIGLDIGGKTRNGISVMDEDFNLLEYTYIPYESKRPYDHRMRVVSELRSLYDKYYEKDKDVYVLFEKINLFRGGRVSPLANIISLAKIQTTIIDELSDIINISEVMVRSWKAKILNSAKASKEDSIKYVEKYYPDVNLKIEVYHPRKKETEIIINHDLADSICIARFGIESGKKWLDSHSVNYQ